MMLSALVFKFRGRTAGATLALFLCTALIAGCQRKFPSLVDPPTPRYTAATGFVGLDDGHFVLHDTPWFPLMVNYKTDLVADSIVPARYYGQGTLEQHFDTIARWGFNSVRVCADFDFSRADTSRLFSSIGCLLAAARRHDLRVMLLIRPPFEQSQLDFTSRLLSRFATDTTLFAYDFFNEPLYFDPLPDRPKQSAIELSRQWRRLMDAHAPHQLFTIALAEPIEVFEWDASLLDVDFIQMHTYHPLRIPSELYWYGHFCRRPWMVGETSLPADGDSVPLSWQALFMSEAYQQALGNGAIGFGWWEFQDCPEGVNFEARYAGLRRADGSEKPAASVVATLRTLPPAVAAVPVNYYNMLGYSNLALSGTVVDAGSRAPIVGAVVRGWNADWSVGQNSYSDSSGRFMLYSNDRCFHFQISAPGYESARFDYRPAYPASDSLPRQHLEYQSIDYRPFLLSPQSILTLRTDCFTPAVQPAVLPEIRLSSIVKK